MNTGIVTYRRNPLYEEQNAHTQPQLFAELDLTRMGVDDKVRNLPIYYQMLSKPIGSIRVIYTTYIAGLMFEAGNLSRLEAVIADMAKVLIRFERLPAYVFQIEDNAWPIFQLHDDELVTRYPGGPVFSAEDIGSLRVWLAEHFKELGRIKHRREMDLLCLSPYDLQLYTPLFVLRTPGESIPDIPIFPLPGDKSLGMSAPVSRESITMPYNDPTQVFEIQAAVGERLVKQGVLHGPLDSTIRKYSLGAWEKLSASLPFYGQSLTYIRQRDGEHFRQTLPVYQYEDLLVAGRINRINRVVLYAAENLPELVQRVGADLQYYGAIDDPGSIQTQATELAEVKENVLDAVA